MQKNISTPTIKDLSEAYIAFLEKLRKPNPKDFALCTERLLSDFIRKYHDQRFNGIYDQLDHNYYDRLRAEIATHSDMREADDLADLAYSVHLRTYSSFLDSKDFRILFSSQQASAKKNDKSKAKDGNIFPMVRELTEGEKRHVEYERAHRNPALRNACIKKYGYQCQCCGMDFVSLYGEELGAGFIEVHHLKMISDFENQCPDDYLENLVPLCPNCHSMIHHGKNGPLTLAQLRAAYKGEKRKIKVWKQD